MTREEFARFLEKLRKADEKGEDTDAIVNPFIPGDLGYRNSEPDLLLTNDRDDAAPRDRISIEIQHDGDTIYKHRVVLYVSRHISNMVKKNAPPVLENLNLISFQFTDAFPWNHSKNYRHSVQFYNQEKPLYFEPLMITVVEVNKFFGHADVFASDRSRLAQWLRAIDTLNREADFAEFVTDPVFRVLQEEVKLCNFSSRYLMTDEMKSIDNAMIEFRGREKVARNLLKFGLDPKIIAQNTELPLYWVINLKKEMELAEV
ncbi:MAG: PD-(D/E)XK nuclease family transposase [Fibrobacter sp.]|nr:PD-(D/E)XK nuclease family transposase [Fibrobacter sp.]